MQFASVGVMVQGLRPKGEIREYFRKYRAVKGRTVGDAPAAHGHHRCIACMRSVDKGVLPHLLQRVCAFHSYDGMELHTGCTQQSHPHATTTTRMQHMQYMKLACSLDQAYACPVYTSYRTRRKAAPLLWHASVRR